MAEPVSDFLRKVLNDVRDQDEGELADYIAPLRDADPTKLAIAVCTTSGHRYAVGDAEHQFSMQSLSKPFVYALALDELGKEGVDEFVGVDPSGEAFNELSLEEDTKRPANPMINAGAMTVHQLVRPEVDADERIEFIRSFLSRLAGRQLEIDEDLAAAEFADAHRNFSIAHMLRNYGIISGVPDEVVRGYTWQCSVLVDVQDLAVMAATLANGGVQPITRERVLSAQTCRITQAVMSSAGMYDAAGRWMTDVGIPAKSGVSGGLIGTLPGQNGVATFSPRLDKTGTSVRGVKIFKKLSADLGMHMMDANYYAAPGVRSIRRAAGVNVVELQGMINFAAAENILYDLERADLDDGQLILDTSNVTAFNVPGRRLLKDAVRAAIDAGRPTVFYDPVHVLPDLELADGRIAETIDELPSEIYL